MDIICSDLGRNAAAKVRLLFALLCGMQQRRESAFKCQRALYCGLRSVRIAVDDLSAALVLFCQNSEAPARCCISPPKLDST